MSLRERNVNGWIPSWMLCISTYRDQLDEDGQVDFKGKAKAFLRSYGFLATILPYTVAEWEKLSILPDLPSPQAARARGR